MGVKSIVFVAASKTMRFTPIYTITSTWVTPKVRREGLYNMLHSGRHSCKTSLAELGLGMLPSLTTAPALLRMFGRIACHCVTCLRTLHSSIYFAVRCTSKQLHRQATTGLSIHSLTVLEAEDWRFATCVIQAPLGGSQSWEKQTYKLWPSWQD